MSDSTKILDARIKAVNAANDYANGLFDELSPIFAKLVGQKVFKIDGEWLEKHKSILPVFAKTWNDVSIHVYRASSRYSLGWTVKACANIDGGCGCVYHETSVYIANIDGQNLSSMYDKPNQHKTDYTAEDVTAKRETYKRLKKLADEAQSALHPFGEYDR
jgi:hypothetical protein